MQSLDPFFMDLRIFFVFLSGRKTLSPAEALRRSEGLNNKRFHFAGRIKDGSHRGTGFTQFFKYLQKIYIMFPLLA